MLALPDMVGRLLLYMALTTLLASLRSIRAALAALVAATLNHTTVEVVFGLHHLKEFLGRHHALESLVVVMFQLSRLHL